MSGPRQWFLRVPAPLDAQRKPLWVSANDHSHWRVRQGRAKLWRESAKVAAMQHRLPKGIQRFRIDAVVHYPNGSRMRDASNLMPTLKHLVDGLVADYGFAPGDDDRHITTTSISAGPQLERPAFSITLTEEPS